MLKKLWYLVVTASSPLLFFGGLGTGKLYIGYLGLLVSILLLVFTWFSKKKIDLPNGSKLYALFLLLLVANLLWSKNLGKTLEYLVLFTSGGAFWLIFYNQKREFRGLVDKLIVALGLVFGSLFLGNYFFGDPQVVRPRSLYLQSSAYFSHNHIGDLWAIVLIVAAYQLIKHKRLNFFFLIPLGAFLLLISLSRSAYVALATGVIYLVVKTGGVKKHKEVFAVLVGLAATLFVVVGFHKPTIMSRPYFVQAALGIARNPFGVGVGNFDIISKDPAYLLWWLIPFSSVVHNVVLEILVGMGILGTVFIVWQAKIAWELWSDKNKKTLLYKAIFFALLANFFFDATYFVPTMLWLWFMILGLSQKQARG